ncbi:hypothetical protein PVK06_048997 [Gossypium arboreum]|uniref:Uncharacterized protein n=1 Tax=Gossypium arboreum TaxID=29729 RepID=A0ABR0MHS4_GOSAR|nr:hypothetical protein PVK06_048997 [Gossypium arboreum]
MEGKEKESGLSIFQCITKAEGTKEEEEENNHLVLGCTQTSKLVNKYYIERTTTIVRKIGQSDTSQYQHSRKGPRFKWKGKKAVTIRQIMQQHFDVVQKKRGNPSKQVQIRTQASQRNSIIIDD